MAMAERIRGDILSKLHLLVKFHFPVLEILPRFTEAVKKSVESYLALCWLKTGTSVHEMQADTSNSTFQACIQLIGFSCSRKYMKVLFKLLNTYFLLCSSGDYFIFH